MKKNILLITAGNNSKKNNNDKLFNELEEKNSSYLINRISLKNIDKNILKDNFDILVFDLEKYVPGVCEKYTTLKSLAFDKPLIVLSNEYKREILNDHVIHLSQIYLIKDKINSDILDKCINRMFEISVINKEKNEIIKELLELNDELSDLAATDFLTGILNKRSLYSMLEKEVARSSRYGSSLSLLILDLDHFKNINDTYGHLLGDEVLKHISFLAVKNIRTTDIMGRFGGEEFFIILSETNEKGAYRVAEKLREIIAETPLVFDSTLIKATVSIGVSSYRFGDSASSLISKADQALYEAKNMGRNCVSKCLG